MVHEYDTPIDGEIMLNQTRNIKVRLRYDSEKNLILELLEKDIPEFSAKELKGIFKGFCKRNYNITFFNCRKSNAINCVNINFDSYISCEYDSEDSSDDFLNKDSLVKELDFRINHFDNWLYSGKMGSTKSKLTFLDENKSEISVADNAKYLEILISNKSNVYNFQYKNKNLKLYIIDTLGGNYYKPSEIKLFQKCSLKIESEMPQSISFFIDLIQKIKKLFSLFFNEVAKIKSVTGNDLDYFVIYNLINDKCEEDGRLSMLFNIFYEDINQNLGDIIQNWLNIYDEYEFIITEVCFFDEIKTLSSSISEYAQLLETYGNIINKGAGTRADIKRAVFELKPENFQKIFHIDKKREDFLTFDFNAKNLSEDVHTQMELVGEQISKLRNHAIHPYKNGKLKTPKDSEIHEILIQNEGLKLEAVDVVVKCAFKILVVLLLQKLNIDEYYANF